MAPLGVRATVHLNVGNWLELGWGKFCNFHKGISSIRPFVIIGILLGRGVLAALHCGEKGGGLLLWVLSRGGGGEMLSLP
jgi:hypothetical protein